MVRVAQAHALHRMQFGFGLDQLLSEYRALRASVIRLWNRETEPLSAESRKDLTRFNEAIDEGLTEAVKRFTEKLEEYREQFLAVLGHDLRNPLAAIEMSATFLSRSEGLDDRHARAAARILNASERMNRMVGDLLDLTRTRLGEGISVTRRSTNLGTVCRRALDELEAFHPDRDIVFECEGDLIGEWDEDRLEQIISNLAGNALQHGDGRRVTVRARATDGNVTLTVHNFGETIPRSAFSTIFDPMVRASTDDDDPGRVRSLGLGLFIVRELVAAHGGTVSVESLEEAGTTFTVRLPRAA